MAYSAFFILQAVFWGYCAAMLESTPARILAFINALIYVFLYYVNTDGDKQ
jgi:hypothetical protein